VELARHHRRLPSVGDARDLSSSGQRFGRAARESAAQIPGSFLRALAAIFFLLAAAAALAQGKAATPAEARAYIHGAFLTHAAPSILSERVKLGAELERRLALPAGASSTQIYDALCALTDNRTLEVRSATREELAGLGAEHPVYVLEAGPDLKLLVQYDLRANNIAFVGLPGAPASRPVAAAAPLPVKQGEVVTLVWDEVFDYKKTTLSAAARAHLDSEVLPKIRSFAEIRSIGISGHADSVGSPAYNQRISEERAQAVRAYLVKNGVAASKIKVAGHGKSTAKPCAGADKEECLAASRRVQIEVQGTLK
jgi:outer membrane protein OmpA-like peptidoglycan-associated protein